MRLKSFVYFAIMIIPRTLPRVCNSEITPLLDTPNKRLRDENGDSTSDARSLALIEDIILSAIANHIQVTIQQTIQVSIENGLKALELELDLCKKHHEEIKCIRSDYCHMADHIEKLEQENQKLKKG